MREFSVADHEPSILPDGNWTLAWSDEFDGTELDETKWSFRYHLFHKRHECFVGKEGIELDGESCIRFKQVEKDGKLYSSQLQTGENWYDRPSQKSDWNVAKLSESKFEHKFGYYEIRCKLQKGDNWWSSFWLQSPNIGTHINEKKAGVEVDILESFYGGSYIPHYIHWGGYGENYRCDTTNPTGKGATADDITEVDSGFHRFGCLWDEEGYTFFVDGVQSGPKLTKGVSHTEEFILVGTECVGYRGYIPGVYKDCKNVRVVKNDEFIVDYVRVFDRL